MRWKRWLGIIGVLAAVAAAVFYGFREQPVLVEVAQVQRGPLRVTIEEEGKARVTDRFVVSAPVAGYARRIALEVGDAVARGQTITLLEPQAQRSAVLDPRARAEGEARVRRAEAALAEAESRLPVARADVAYWEGQFDRVEKLHRSGDLARETYERALADKRRADANFISAERAVAVAKAEVEAARVALVQPTNAEIRPKGDVVPVSSPVAGRVLRVVRKSEGPVNTGHSKSKWKCFRPMPCALHPARKCCWNDGAANIPCTEPCAPWSPPPSRRSLPWASRNNACA